MRLAWMGDFALTGFGTVTTDVSRPPLELGEDVRCLSQNDLPGLDEPFLSRTVDATSFHLGLQGVEDIAKFIPDLIAGKSDVTLTNGDPWGDWRPDACI